jgi:signal transduction histidine kinase
MGFSQILRSRSKGDLNDYQLEMINRIFANGENLLNLVNDILDMSTLESNRLELSPSAFDLTALIYSTIAELKPLADKKSLALRLADEVPNLTVFNDKKRLKQILTNLISNAIKFTDSGYVLVEIHTSAPNGILIKVTDTGIGISPEQLDHIFQPFRQGDQTTQRRHPGTGLGLAITESLVNMMEGSITVESQVNEGTTFIVSIPQRVKDPADHRADVADPKRLADITANPDDLFCAEAAEPTILDKRN